MKNPILSMKHIILFFIVSFLSSISNAQPKIFLKLDDFSAKNSSCLSIPTFDYLLSKQIKAGLGATAIRFDGTALSILSPYLNATNAQGEKLFEVWHHGLDHIAPEFEGTGYIYQKTHFDSADQLIRNYLRIQMNAFGAPFNANDDITNTVVSENPLYKVSMFNNPAAGAATGILNLTNRVNMENGTGNPEFSYFLNNYNTYKNSYTNYMVLQGHPNVWATAELNQFKLIIDFLIAEGCEFVLPFEYYLSLNPGYPVPTQSQTISFAALPAGMAGDADFNAGATASSGLTVTYNSSNAAVASIVNGNIHIVGAGTSIITASQMGNATFKPALYLSQTLMVNAIDFRSAVATGNWSTASSWEARDAMGNWATASNIPTASNNVYIQNGHYITVDITNAFCNDLHINNAATSRLAIGINTMNVSGKIRAYTGAAVIGISANDGSFYTGQISTTTLAATMITTGTNGVLKFIGTSRNITNAGEWAGAGTTNFVDFALDAGAKGTLGTAIKFRTITFSSGTITTAYTISAGSTSGNGNLTIKNRARLLSSRTFTSAGSQVITYNSISKCGIVTIEPGGTLELAGAAPVIDCAGFINNGIVQYSGTSQSLLIPSVAGSFALFSYNDLNVGSAVNLTLPANSSIIISGTLTLTSGTLTIPATDTVSITSGNAIVGEPFSSSKYIKCAVSGNNVGVLSIDNFAATTLFPVGSMNNYLPVSLTPGSAMGYTVNVFEAVTIDGTVTGTPVSAAQKETVVDAVWNINRTAGAGDCQVQLSWNESLEGTLFNSYSNSQIGIGRYNGTDWGTAIGAGDNSINTATALFNSFSPFIVSKTGSVLPLQLKNLYATIKSTGVAIGWNVWNEDALLYYEIEKSINRVNFVAIGMLQPANRLIYQFMDMAPFNGVAYYRLKITCTNGQVKYSDIIVVKPGNSQHIAIYPNPVSNVLQLTGLKDNTIIKIINAAGQLVHMERTTANSLSIGVAEFKAGIYVIEFLNDNSRVFTKEFIKE